jgi:thioredoxin-dependent peroxiredoxin
MIEVNRLLCGPTNNAGDLGRDIPMKATTAGLVLLGCVLAAPASAALKVGDAAPDFSAPAVLGDKEFTFSLSEALKRGPVVVYFYPKAFTHGCTIEAHEFAEATASFTEAGASLIGISADTIETQKEFSLQECRSKFPVAADPNFSVIHAYDAAMFGNIAAKRISYVIAPDGKILYTFSDSSPDKHVENTLAIVRQWHQAAPR